MLPARCHTPSPRRTAPPGRRVGADYGCWGALRPRLPLGTGRPGQVTGRLAGLPGCRCCCVRDLGGALSEEALRSLPSLTEDPRSARCPARNQQPRSARVRCPPGSLRVPARGRGPGAASALLDEEPALRDPVVPLPGLSRAQSLSGAHSGHSQGHWVYGTVAGGGLGASSTQGPVLDGRALKRSLKSQLRKISPVSVLANC